LVVALHKITQKQLPVLFFCAGLPQLAALAGDAKSYSERLFHCWNIADGSVISTIEVHQAAALVQAQLDSGFFKVRFDRLTPKEREYIIAMAQLGPCRASIIRKGMIYSPAHGDVAFTVPLFDAYLKRIKNA
jgi:hypothetical protein